MSWNTDREFRVVMRLWIGMMMLKSRLDKVLVVMCAWIGIGIGIFVFIY